MFDHAYGNYMVSRKLIFIYHLCELSIMWLVLMGNFETWINSTFYLKEAFKK